MKAALLGLLVACGTSAPPAPAAPAPVADGITRCGPPAPPPPPPPEPVKPAREPMPSFTGSRMAMPDIEGDLSADVVNRVMRMHAEEVRACFLHLVARDPRTDALRVELAFTIVDDGSVAGVEVSGGPPMVDDCVCQRAVAMRFGSIGGRTSVRYPLIFTP